MADQQEIRSDVSAAAEPEIEADESPEKKSEKEPDEGVAAEGDRGEAGCPIVMGYGYTSFRCGRRLHVAPDGVDEKPVCLMHSKDLRKRSGPLFDTFWQEFERILEYAQEGEAHFERFVFPQLNCTWRAFQAFCLFSEANFTQEVDFRFATFTKEANFFKATFAKDANFLHATFTWLASFREATFTGNANFCRAFFIEDATFMFATFKENAVFRGTTFTKNSDFNKATFKQDAYFSNATFEGDAYFSRAIFAQTTNFVDTIFHGTADWQGCLFINHAEFRHTKFDPSVEGQPSAVFALASFSKPGEIVFDDVDLQRVLFHNCDVSQVWFTSSVRWANREGDRGLSIFEETITLKQELAVGLRRDGHRDYRAVAQIYQQLKKNYDSRLDYWTANEFHYGKMEMKRLFVLTDSQHIEFEMKVLLCYLRTLNWIQSRLDPVVWLRYPRRLRIRAIEVILQKWDAMHPHQKTEMNNKTSEYYIGESGLRLPYSMDLFTYFSEEEVMRRQSEGSLLSGKS